MVYWYLSLCYRIYGSSVVSIEQKVGELSGKLDMVIDQVGRLGESLRQHSEYTHERNHDIINELNGIGGLVRLHNEKIKKLEDNCLSIRQDVSDLKKGSQRQMGFVAGVSASISLVIGALGTWLKLGSHGG